mgnify:FL=1
MKHFLTKNIIFAFLICSTSLTAESIRIGLGSCLDQNYPQPIWKPIKDEDINYFVFLGDNVYGDSPTGSLKKMERAYSKQKSLLPKFLDDIEVFSIWDDHDYGINDGGMDYKNKELAEDMFLEFWEIPSDDIRHKRDGIYFSNDILLFNKTFKLLFLDTRFFRSELKGRKGKYLKNESTDATILGKTQWKWLTEELNQKFDFLIIFSSIQIIPEDHGYEKWGNFPNDRKKLLNILAQFKDKTILVSGDRHRGGLYKKNGIYEITASSMNKPGSFAFETDKFLIGNTFPEENYGLLEISSNEIDIKLKDKSGKILNSIKLNY